MNKERNFCYDFSPGDLQVDSRNFKSASWACKNEVTDPMGQLAMFLAGGCYKDSSPDDGAPTTHIAYAGVCSKVQPWGNRGWCGPGKNKALLTEHLGTAWSWWGYGIAFQPRSQWSRD